MRPSAKAISSARQHLQRSTGHAFKDGNRVLGIIEDAPTGSVTDRRQLSVKGDMALLKAATTNWCPTGRPTSKISKLNVFR